MRYPTGDGTKEDFENRYYIAFGFGEKTDYGYHEGADINLKTGGDSDLGEPLNAIADCNIPYYHLKSHLESGFGEHIVYKVESPWGPRWIHYAHNQNSVDPKVKSDYKKGDKLAEIDKTGRPRFLLVAHCHMAVFKVDPITLPNGIDTFARTQKQLNDWWEDPVDFMNRWYNEKGDMISISDIIKGARIGLLDAEPSGDELRWDIGHWEGVASFISRITGDGKFYKKYILPQLENAQIVFNERFNEQENAHKQDISDLTTDWQNKVKTAKKQAVKDIPEFELFVLAFGKLFDKLKNLIKRG